MKAVADRILHAFSLVITDRRWAAPLSASALGFGLFVGVAIGPSAAETLAGAAQIVEEVPSGDGGAEAKAEAGSGLGGSLAGSGGGGLGGEGGSLEAPLAPVPLAPEPTEPAPEEPAPEPATPGPEPPVEEEKEGESELTGVVVHANRAAGSYALAIEGGELVPVHARELPPPGARLTATARRLANGTFAEAELPKRSGKASQVKFRGVVTYADPDPLAPAYTVSGRGASLLVHVEPDPSGALPALPAVGSRVTVAAAFGEGLRQRTIEVEEGAPATYLDLAGIVQAVLPDTAQLVLSADDADESETDLTLTVPAKIDVAALAPGDSVLATATVEPDGSLALAGLASDEQIKGADDEASAQGDLKR